MGEVITAVAAIPLTVKVPADAVIDPKRAVVMYRFGEVTTADE